MEQHKLPKIQEMAASSAWMDTFHCILGHSDCYILFLGGIQGSVPLHDFVDHHFNTYSVLQ